MKLQWVLKYFDDETEKQKNLFLLVVIYFYLCVKERRIHISPSGYKGNVHGLSSESTPVFTLSAFFLIVWFKGNGFMLGSACRCLVYFLLLV